MALLRNYAITLVSFAVIDSIWLGVVARNFYRDQIGFLLKSNTNWIAAALFYLLYIVGLLFFVIQPALTKQSWQHALFAGMFFGLVTYMTYDLTNLATLEGWPVLVTVVDLLWGTLLGGTVSLLSYSLIRALA